MLSRRNKGKKPDQIIKSRKSNSKKKQKKVERIFFSSFFFLKQSIADITDIFPFFCLFSHNSGFMEQCSQQDGCSSRAKPLGNSNTCTARAHDCNIFHPHTHIAFSFFLFLDSSPACLLLNDFYLSADKALR